MGVRTKHFYFQATLLLLCSAFASAQDDGGTFDCHIDYNGLKYDLTTLAGLQTVTRQRDTPPSSMIDTVMFNLCADLEPQNGVDEKDQCPSGTRACLTKTNRKDGGEDRIVAVIPLASSPLDDFQYSELSSPKGLSISFKGPSYPSPTTADPVLQSFNVRLLCDPNKTDLTFHSYDGSEMWVEWSAPSGCGFGGPTYPPGDMPTHDDEEGGEQRSVGSGIGYFFLLLLLALVAYFGLGAYHNYSNYGATGADLIPHRDFWREVPYMLRDVASHLCSAVRPQQASRGGYIAV